MRDGVLRFRMYSSKGCGQGAPPGQKGHTEEPQQAVTLPGTDDIRLDEGPVALDGVGSGDGLGPQTRIREGVPLGTQKSKPCN